MDKCTPLAWASPARSRSFIRQDMAELCDICYKPEDLDRGIRLGSYFFDPGSDSPIVLHKPRYNLHLPDGFYRLELSTS